MDSRLLTNFLRVNYDEFVGIGEVLQLHPALFAHPFDGGGIVEVEVALGYHDDGDPPEEGFLVGHVVGSFA